MTFPEAGKGEISWDVFGGEQAPLLAQLLVDRCKLENDQETLFTTTEFKDSLLTYKQGLTHLIGAKKVNTISDLASS